MSNTRNILAAIFFLTCRGGDPLEREHLHPYTLGTVSEDKCHDKKQIHTRAKDPDRAGINQNQHKHGRTVPQAQRPPTDVS